MTSPRLAEDRLVQPGRLHPSGVVDEADVGVASGDRSDDVAGAIVRTTVGDDHLVAIRRVVLVEDRFEARRDVALLVVDRDDHTDVWLA